MSPDWTSLLPWIAAAWVSGLAFGGGPLLWAWLRYRPLSHRAWRDAAWTFVSVGFGFTVVLVVEEAYGRGLISLPARVAAIGVLLLMLLGARAFFQRRYPSRRE